MIMTADQCADSEEAKVRFNKDAGTHRSTHHINDHPDKQCHSHHRYDDRGHHQDSSHGRPKWSKASQYCRHRLDNIVTTIDEPHAKHNYDEQYKKILEGLCPLHKNSKHKMRDCLGLANKF